MTLSINNKIRIIHPVHANKPTISKFNRQRFNALPIPCCIPPIISAMTPTLKANDRPEFNNDNKVGRSSGKYIFFKYVISLSG